MFPHQSLCSAKNLVLLSLRSSVFSLTWGSVLWQRWFCHLFPYVFFLGRALQSWLTSRLPRRRLQDHSSRFKATSPKWAPEPLVCGVPSSRAFALLRSFRSTYDFPPVESSWIEKFPYKDRSFFTWWVSGSCPLTTSLQKRLLGQAHQQKNTPQKHKMKPKRGRRTRVNSTYYTLSTGPSALHT